MDNRNCPPGLSSTEARARAAAGRANRTAVRTHPYSRILLDNTFSLFNLVIGFIVAFLLFYWWRTGNADLAWDTVGVSAVALLNTAIAIAQEIRAKWALDKVNLLLRHDVSVVRDGCQVAVPQAEVVEGDVLNLVRGDQVAVDGCVLEASHLEIDESLLTGESKPILKKAGDTLLSGSFCTAGTGFYRADRVGEEAFAASVMRSAKTRKMLLTPLQRRLDVIVKVLFATALALVVLEVVFRLARAGGGGEGTGLLRLFWEKPDPEVIRKLATILSSLVPQGLVLTASATFALGVYRISRLGAIVQKLNAVESFSNVQVICTDKTGTLTQNRLELQRLYPCGPQADEGLARRLLAACAALSTERNATIRALDVPGGGEGAVMLDEAPFSSALKYSAFLLSVDGREEVLVLGGFDVLLPRADQAAQEALRALYEREGLDVYRNLLFGRLKGRAALEDGRQGRAFEVAPLAVVAITDKVRTDVYDAMRVFEEKGIAIKILSGDAAPAVRAVCREIGWLVRPDEAVSGEELDRMTEGEFGDIVGRGKVFARLKPDHKLRILRELKRQGLYTAMLGDGVNDLPAIKEAHMGIAMEEGSAVTRDVADIVLLGNRFALLPGIFQEGNRIVNTVASVAKLFLTKNFMVIYLTLLSLLFLLEFPLTPRRVSLINVFAIGLPAFILAFRNRNTGRPVRLMGEILSYVSVSALCLVGASALAGTLVSRNGFGQADEARMTMLVVLVFVAVANFLVVALPGGGGSRRLYSAYAGGLVGVFLVLALASPAVAPFGFLRQFYEIRNLPAVDWLWALVSGSAGAAALVGLDRLRRRLFPR